MSMTRDQKSIMFIFIILAIAMVLGIVMFFTFLRSDPIADTLRNEQVFTTLFVLHDDEGNALATDVFIYYPPSRKGALFDILGNTGGIYASLGRVDRIDAIYKEKGLDAYRNEVSRLTDLDIPFFVEIRLEDFGQLTDLMGGLKLFVPTPVDMLSPQGERWLLPSGAVNLDGDKIQTYIAYRLDDESESDVEDRRQNAIVAFFSALKDNRATMLDKKNFPMYGTKLSFNIDDESKYRLLEQISNVDIDSLTLQTLIGSTRVVSGKTLLFPYQDGQLIKDVIKQKIRTLMNDNEQGKRQVYMIEVKNGTLRQGLARNASILLQNAGYDILQTSNADRSDYEHTVIIDHSGNEDAAKSFGDFITCYNIITELDPLDDGGNVDFTLILGQDWDGRYVRGGFGKDDGERIDATAVSK